MCSRPAPERPRDRVAFAVALPVRHHGRSGRCRHRSRRRCPAARHGHAGQLRHHGDADRRHRRQRRLHLLPALFRRLRSAIRRRRIQDCPHVPGGRQCGRGSHAGCRPGARRNRRTGALPVPHQRHHILHQHLGQFQDHHRRAADHAQLHADSVDGLRLRRRRQQRRHPGTRHAQRQRQRQYQRRVLHPGWRSRPQRRAEPRHNFGVKDPNFSIRRGLRRAGPEHRPHHQERRARISRRRLGIRPQRRVQRQLLSSAPPPGNPNPISNRTSSAPPWAARSAAGSSSSSAPTRARGRSTDWTPLRPPTPSFRR